MTAVPASDAIMASSSVAEASPERNSMIEEKDMIENSDNGDQEEENTCPLFMVGLPKDFTKNSHLQALASLMNETDASDDDNSECTVKTGNTKAGGGRCRNRKSREKRRKVALPYQKKSKPKATVGEAHLFLKMWKL